jgi:hypothetical protein
MHGHMKKKFLINIAYCKSLQCTAMAPEIASLGFSA